MNITPDFHPDEVVILILSDLARLYGHDNSGCEQLTQKRRDIATSQKFGFYAAGAACPRRL